MKKATIALLLMLGLLIGVVATPFVMGDKPGESSVDKSMITTETGVDKFFLDEGETKFLWDILFDEERKLEVPIHITNPEPVGKEAGTKSSNIRIDLSTSLNPDWEYRIIEVIDHDDNEVGPVMSGDEVVPGRYLVQNVPGGERITVILEVRYLGDDTDVEDDLNITVTLDESFSVTKQLYFEVGEGNYIFIWLALAFSIVGLVFALLIVNTIRKRKVEDEKLLEISGHIQEGSKAFLNAEYRVIAFFVIGVVLFMFVGIFALGMSWRLIPAFLLGAVFSATAGNIGMRVATMANAKTAWACKDKMTSGLRVAFQSGAVMGLTVVGMGLLGVTLLYAIFGDVKMLFGFGFGASSIALFARVGGGIYTKAADVGADLVGKVEVGIPEDDPRNPATIADNVGDNVGDVAGMGADLFESYVDSIIAAMALGIMGVSVLGGKLLEGGSAGLAVMLPLFLAGVGILSAILGTFFVGGKEGKDPHKQLNRGIYGSSIIMTIAAFVIIYLFFKDMSVVWPLFFSLSVGLGAGIVIGKATEYFTSDKAKPTRRVAEAAQTSPATNIIAGLGLGMKSTIIPVLAVVVTIIVAFIFSGLYGIALAAVGMLSTLGITLATDTYGPVADNAAGLAEMAGMGKVVRRRAEELDAVGNTTAAIGKGFAIGSAGLTALALFSVFTQEANLDLSQFTLINPYVVAGLFLGGLLPFIFSALTMEAVGNAAQGMVEEVRRQFREIKGIMEGEVKPDYQKCVSISTQSALRYMILPSMIAVVVPIIVGCISLEALGGLLAGSIVTGFVLAVMMANSGGAWDNAKKYIESGALGGKGSDSHKAAVVGDTVGDPFKDTSGPSLNILIKLMSIVSLVFVPLFLILNSLW